MKKHTILLFFIALLGIHAQTQEKFSLTFVPDEGAAIEIGIEDIVSLDTAYAKMFIKSDVAARLEKLSFTKVSPVLKFNGRSIDLHLQDVLAAALKLPAIVTGRGKVIWGGENCIVVWGAVWREIAVKYKLATN